MDPLSDILSLIKPDNYLSAGFDAGAPWAIQFPDQGKNIKTGAIVKGECWISVDGIAEPVLLQTGDCVLLPHGRAFLMGSSLDQPPIHAQGTFKPERYGHIRTINGGGDCVVASSRFGLAGPQADLLLNMLPPIVVIRDRHESTRGQSSQLRYCIECTMAEMRRNDPGSKLILQHLAHMMLIEALRLYMNDDAKGVGWFFALADPKISIAISAIHANPAHGWTVEELAQTAAMSRSAFAAKFRDKVGESPMAYLTRWRMLLAGEKLRTSREPISQISLSLGYESESAFSTAFKRVMGCSPRGYGKVETAPELKE
ncbi:AraC family transcriptional regulator [Thalassospira povalilytica]|uniref:AraC family transcriptional regulator n=1 Tax=Thalassospira povalilytica TaxID=732237 RepID=UPI003AA97A64